MDNPILFTMAFLGIVACAAIAWSVTDPRNHDLATLIWRVALVAFFVIEAVAILILILS